MQIGFVGLGRMGGNMVKRLQRAGHACVVFDLSAENVASCVSAGATAATSVADVLARLDPPGAIWLMLPAALVDRTINGLRPHLRRGDIVIDGGNSCWRDDVRRAKDLSSDGIEYVDVGVSGGVWGLEYGYCQMVGGSDAAVARVAPILATLAPGASQAPPTPGRDDSRSTAHEGWLHTGPAGAGHFVKMVHNGIEYGMMAAYAEGLNILRHANVGKGEQTIDAETAPVRDPELYQYDLDVAEISEVWRRGSVIRSWLLDLTAQAMAQDHTLDGFAGNVADSGEGRWTVEAAIAEGVPADVLTAALFARFSSRGRAGFANKVLSAMRLGFGGHIERPHAG
ncbi:MAG: decarboxylating 6-phosphogluconate dehydrogenase [Planctomycetota bacterium]|nr:decarboxylating 6-phosphogluconate dehydrogenase [Planctomycetota bacterium]MDA1105034.1 decarboxylating 6-phosphogluconate dehydrogenase [Planctomycetota bacterium]